MQTIKEICATLPSWYPELSELIRQRDKASREYNELQRDGAFWTKAYHEYSRLVVQVGHAKKQARAEFASRLGWRHLDRKHFSLDQLRTGRARMRVEDYGNGGYLSDGCVDHPEYFKLDGKPIGIVSHTYYPLGKCVEYAKAERLQLNVIPTSWYLPGRCLAFLLTRLEPQPETRSLKSREVPA
jgi:hypothetical protein